MPHLDPERLSLLALYDDWQDGGGREHLRTCPECAADYAALRRAVDAVKTTPDTSGLQAPGPQVWAGIHRELGLSESLQEDPLATGPDRGKSAEQPHPRGSAAPLHSVPESGQVALSQPEARAGRSRTAAWWQRPGTWLAAAAATVLVASATVWTLNRAPEPLAQADLTPLAKFSATGSARVVSAPDGSRTLEVKLSKDEAQGYQEVWLIAPDLSRLVSLGVMNSDSGTFEVPAGLELADFPIVDVSDEPVDGNPAHSSISIVRGTLRS
ncbi:MAG TPA: anti-sigma factor [Arthrobacter sp.]|nr:anti-sigma factor [Arthrobacter sp.]